MHINVAKVAKLANLTLTADEEKKFEEQLSSTIDYINQLNEINTDTVEPTSQVTGLENVTRIDVSHASLTQEEALANTKKAHNGFIKVEAILDNG